MPRRDLTLWLCLCWCSLGACESPEPQAEPTSEQPSASSQTAAATTRLNAPPEMIHRARREASGLERMPERLREEELARRVERATVSAQTLHHDAETHLNARIAIEGEIALVRSAGSRLWIAALRPLEAAPIYVLSVRPLPVPADGGGRARIHGWVAGRRRIGEHELPLVIAYAATPLD